MNVEDAPVRRMEDALAIVDPVGLWKSGGCWAYTADPNWEDKVERSIGEYAATHGGKQYQKASAIFI